METGVKRSVVAGSGMVRNGRYIGKIPCPDATKPIMKPFEFGIDCGKEWVKTASPEAIEVAAERETMKECINRFFSSGGHVNEYEAFF